MLLSIVIDVISVTLSIIMIVLSGVYLIKLKVIEQKQIRIVSKMSEQLFQPCLIIASFIKALDISQVDIWGSVVFLSVISIAQGLSLAWTTNKFILKDNTYGSILILSSGLAMTTNFQLNIAHNIRDYLNEISITYIKTHKVMSEGEQRAITYIMIYTVINTIARWTVGKFILINDKLQNHAVEEESQQQKVQELQVMASSFQTEYHANKQYLLDQSKLSPKLIGESNSYLQRAKELLDNPPLIASIIAIIVVSIPKFRDNILSQGTFLNRALFNSLEEVGNVSQPIILLFLGFVLYYSDFKNSKLSKKSLVGISIIKLLINPLVGSLILFIFWKSRLVQDPVIVFVSLISFATPCAINVLIIANLYSDKQQEVSLILLFQYLACIITLPIIMVVFFSTFQQ